MRLVLFKIFPHLVEEITRIMRPQNAFAILFDYIEIRVIRSVKSLEGSYIVACYINCFVRLEEYTLYSFFVIGEIYGAFYFFTYRLTSVKRYPSSSGRFAKP